MSFDGTPATFAVVSEGELTATVPAGAAIGTITVTTPQGTVKGPKFTVK